MDGLVSDGLQRRIDAAKDKVKMLAHCTVTVNLNENENFQPTISNKLEAKETVPKKYILLLRYIKVDLCHLKINPHPP